MMTAIESARQTLLILASGVLLILLVGDGHDDGRGLRQGPSPDLVDRVGGDPRGRDPGARAPAKSHGDRPLRLAVALNDAISFYAPARSSCSPA